MDKKAFIDSYVARVITNIGNTVCDELTKLDKELDEGNIDDDVYMSIVMSVYLSLIDHCMHYVDTTAEDFPLAASFFLSKVLDFAHERHRANNKYLSPLEISPTTKSVN